MTKTLILCSLFATFILTGKADGQFRKFSFSDKSTMQLQGTSTLHDWTCSVTKVAGSIEIDPKIMSKGIWSEKSKIKTLKVSVPVESIKSPRGAAMEKKLYNALKSEKHPTIDFTLNQIKFQTSKNGSGVLEANGMLSVAGVEKPVTLSVNPSFTPEKSVSFAGSYSLNMKDFNVEPPSAMFGQIVSGEQVTITFHVIVNRPL
jgi:polyisoprenoid-binding protein YceI